MTTPLAMPCLPAGRRSLPRGSNDALPNIRNQGLRHCNGAVVLLVVLNNRNKDARRRNCGCIQRMREAHIPFCIAIADIETARLEIVEVGCRAYLPVGILARHPELNVILFDLPEAEVAAAIRDRAIGNIQKFDEFFGVAIQPLMQAHRLVMLGLTKDNLFPFEELMHADEAAHILAVRARLPAEARRECEELHGNALASSVSFM